MSIAVVMNHITVRIVVWVFTLRRKEVCILAKEDSPASFLQRLRSQARKPPINPRAAKPSLKVVLQNPKTWNPVEPSKPQSQCAVNSQDPEGEFGGMGILESSLNPKTPHPSPEAPKPVRHGI